MMLAITFSFFYSGYLRQVKTCLYYIRQGRFRCEYTNYTNNTNAANEDVAIVAY